MDICEIPHNPLKSLSGLFIVHPKILHLILFTTITSFNTGECGASPLWFSICGQSLEKKKKETIEMQLLVC